MKFAAIDVGSNAIRLLLSRVIQDGPNPVFKKESLIRMPIRLGEDVFVHRAITAEKEHQLICAMKGFSHLMDAYQPLRYEAYATSAMREALNGREITARVQTETGIDLRIIDGEEEAVIVFSNHSEKNLDNDREYLYIDIGGGSTQLIFFAEGKPIDARSFRIGTVRMLHGFDSSEEWKSMKRWVKENSKPYRELAAIGSGGNINKIFRLARKKEGKPVSREDLAGIRQYIEGFDLEERIRVLKLRPDRADVILPAADVCLSVIRWAGIRKMYVPQIGLADGMIHMMYDQFKNGQPGQ